MMTLKKVISGGQTGVDFAALRAARDAGLETGGSVPQGFLTEIGPAPLLREFGLVETSSSSYVPRTENNVKNSDATLWYGNTTSRGGLLTRRMCDKHGKAFIIINNDTSQSIFELIRDRGYQTINVAGNRESISPGIEMRAYALLFPAFCGGF